VYRAPRRHLLLSAGLVLLVAHTAGQLLSDSGHMRMATAGTAHDQRHTDENQSAVAVAAREQPTERQLAERLNRDGRSRLLAPSPPGLN